MATIAVYHHVCADEQQRRRRRTALIAALVALFGLATYRAPEPKPVPVPAALPSPRIETRIEIREVKIYSDLEPIGPPPPPRASVAPDTISFGSQRLGIGSPAKLITVVNDGGHLLDVEPSLSGDGFAMTEACPPVLDARADCTLAVVFTPQHVGQHNGVVMIRSRGDVHRIPLHAVALEENVFDRDPDPIREPEPIRDPDPIGKPDPDPKEVLPAIIDPVSIVFESPGREIVRISNPNDVPLPVTAIRLVDGNARGYQMPGLAKCVRTLAPRAYCEFAVIALPNAIRRRERIRLEVSSE